MTALSLGKGVAQAPQGELVAAWAGAGHARRWVRITVPSRGSRARLAARSAALDRVPAQ